MLGRAPLVDELIMRIHLKIEKEVKLQQQMFELAGTLELVRTHSLSSFWELTLKKIMNIKSLHSQ